MTGAEMINNTIEIFGAGHSWVYQLKNVVRNYGDEYAKIFYDAMLESERANLETQIVELQTQLAKIEDMLS